MAAPILTTKLYIPPARPELVPRPRLIERLNAGLRAACKLILISAPPGFGKTTLLSAWIKDRAPHLRAAWLSLDESDNDPACFLSYLIAALQTVDGSIGQSALDALRSPQLPPLEEIVTVLINEIGATPDVIALVLDDYHLVAAQPIHAAVSFLLDHLPGNLHLVIATRSDPPLPLPRLRARGQLTELRQTDLRFTPDEATEFLRRAAGLDLSADDMTALSSRTEGWVAGLQMAALALQAALADQEALPQRQIEASNYIRAFTGDNRYILDYLGEEILQRQPEPVQRFLLQTSILKHLTGSLCDAVTGQLGSEATLEQLERANLFLVPLDDRRQWYRYHRLFADLLRHRLEHAQPDAMPALHLRASEWYEGAAASPTGASMDAALMAEAIEHASLAGDYARAARLIEQAAQPTLASSEVVTLLRWLDLLPSEVVHARPHLLVYQAMALVLSGHSPDVVETILREAEQADSGSTITGEATALRALTAAYQGDAPLAAQLARRALELLPEDNLLLRGFAIGSLGLSYLWGQDLDAAVRIFEEGAHIGEKTGNVMFTVLALRRAGRLRMAQGRLHEAKALFDRALELAVDRRGRRLPIAGTVLIGLGYLCHEWNDLPAATRYLTEGIELAQGASAAMTIGAHLALARVKQAQGDKAGAWEVMQKAERLAAQTETTGLDDLGVAMSQAMLCIDQGDLGSAMAWARSRGLDKPVDLLVRQAGEESPSGLIRRYEIPALAKLMLAQNRPGDVLALLDPLLPGMEREGRIEVVIQIQVLRALAFQATGHPEQALKTLEHALTLAEPSGYIRTFADEGERMRSLIARMLTSEDFRNPLFRGLQIVNQKLCSYADRLLAAFDHAPSLRSPRAEIRHLQSEIVEPLSEREIEVLRLLAAGQSNPEIAQALYVAVSTVRSHAKSIYGKLNVHGRWEAVQRAKELGLL